MATELEIVNSALVKIGAPLTTQESYTAGKTKEDRLAKERLDDLRKDILRNHPWNCAIKKAQSITITVSGTTSGGSGANVSVGELSKALNVDAKYVIFSNGSWMELTASSAKGSQTITGNLTGQVVADTTALVWTNTENIFQGADGLMLPYVQKPEFDWGHSIYLPKNNLRLLDVYNSDKEYRIEGIELQSDIQNPDILYVSDIGLNYLDPSLTEALSWRLASEIAYAITQNPKVIEITSRGYQIALSNAKTVDAQEDGRYYLEAELFDDSRFGSSIFTDYRNHHRP